MSDSHKRLLDVAVSAVLLIVLLPLLLSLMVLVRISIGRPVLFGQMRPGLLGKPFTMYKLRTMREAFDIQGRPLPDVERLTRLGRFLRSWSLDELPELWHVLRGEMSLVGPRPLLLEYLPKYSARQARRHEVRPGITGWAQVKGRNSPSWQRRLELDVWYVEHRSLWLDVKILLLTIVVVLRREGVAQVGQATVERFNG